MSLFTGIDWLKWEGFFKSALEKEGFAESSDPAHDFAHFERVVATVKALCAAEKARPEIAFPAAWLHDLVNVPKNDPRRSQASRLSADKALHVLRAIGYFPEVVDEAGLELIRNAIEAHSFSARIEPKSIEAKIVQDADRLDGVGAIGVARCFAVAGLMKRAFYESDDPFGVLKRDLDDGVYTVDHFFVKLFGTVKTLNTASAREEGARRAKFMASYLLQLAREIGLSSGSYHLLEASLAKESGIG